MGRRESLTDPESKELEEVGTNIVEANIPSHFHDTEQQESWSDIELVAYKRYNDWFNADLRYESPRP